MDLVYMPEVLTYGSFRTPVYRDYEQPWNKNYFQYGKALSNQTTRQQQEQMQQQQLRTNHKENCQLCKESKRRALGSYIRRRSRTSSCNEIHEEEEEDKEEKEEEAVEVATTEGKGNKEEQEKKEIDKPRLQNLREWKTDKFSLSNIKKSICTIEKNNIK